MNNMRLTDEAGRMGVIGLRLMISDRASDCIVSAVRYAASSWRARLRIHQRRNGPRKIIRRNICRNRFKLKVSLSL